MSAPATMRPTTSPKRSTRPARSPSPAVPSRGRKPPARCADRPLSRHRARDARRRRRRGCDGTGPASLRAGEEGDQALKVQAEEWDPQHTALVRAAGSRSDAFARFCRKQYELDAAILKHERRFKEKGKDGAIAYKEAVALAERIRDLRLSEDFDERADYIAFLAGRCLTLKEGRRATGNVYTAIARLEVVNIPECRGRWWPVHLAIPAELRVDGPDAPPFGVQTPDWLFRRSEDVAREIARRGSPPDSPGGGFGLTYDSGILREQPEPDSIPVVRAMVESGVRMS